MLRQSCPPPPFFWISQAVAYGIRSLQPGSRPILDDWKVRREFRSLWNAEVPRQAVLQNP